MSFAAARPSWTVEVGAGACPGCLPSFCHPASTANSRNGKQVSEKAVRFQFQVPTLADKIRHG